MALTLHWADYVVYAIFLTVSMGIGIYQAFTGGKQKTTGEFIMADRKLKVIPTTMSLLVSFQSAIVILSATAEMYTQGSQLYFVGFSSIAIAIFLSERIFVPLFYPLKLVSVNEYLMLRYKFAPIKYFGSLLAILGGAMYIGVATYAPSLALETATGFPLSASIPIMLGVATIYTALGGMRAVIWTDVFQAGIMFGGVLLVLIWGTVQAGGPAVTFHEMASGGRLQFADFSTDPTVRHTFWGLLIGGTATWIGTYGTLQSSVQRFSALPTLGQARKVAYLNIPAFLLFGSIVSSLGMVVFAFYSSKECDPYVSQQISNYNELLSLFVVTIFNEVPGIPGLFLATLYSGALSSISSTLSGKAANIWEDFLKDKLEGRITEFQAALLNKVLVICLGVFGLGVAYFTSILPGTIAQISLALGGAISGPVLGIFLLGATFKVANGKGALTGGVCAFGFLLWIKIGNIFLKPPFLTLPPVGTVGCYELGVPFNGTFTPPEYPEITGFSELYTLSYTWYSVLGAILTFVIGLPVSLFTGGRQQDVPDRYFLTWKMFTSWGDDDGRRKVKTNTLLSEMKSTTDIDIGKFNDVMESPETFIRVQ